MSDVVKGESDEDEVLSELGYRVKRLLGKGTYARVLLAELLRISEERLGATENRLRSIILMGGANSANSAPGTSNPRRRSPAARPYPQLACKVIDTTNAPRDYVRNFLPRELDILGHVHHPHIVHIHSIWQRRSKYFIFMRFAERGDLLDYVLKNGAVTEEQARIWVRQVALAVQYLHVKDIAHRDLKCENILISVNYNAKLADFGFARRVVDANGILMPSTTYCGSLAYAPPEIIEGKPYNPMSADVWSLGVVLFVILNKALPFDTTSAKKQHLQQVTRDWRFRSKVVPLLSDQAKLLTAEMLEPVSTSRLRIDQVLNSAFFAMEPRMARLSVDEENALSEAKESRSRRTNVLRSASKTDPPKPPAAQAGPSNGSSRDPPELLPVQPPGPQNMSAQSHMAPHPHHVDNGSESEQS